MNTTDTIAFVALIIASLSFVVSVITGLLNYLYTKRTFEHTFYPKLQTHMKCEASVSYQQLYQTKLMVDVQNTGNEAVENIEIQAKISDRTREWRLWKPKWVYYAGSRIPILNSRAERTEFIGINEGTEFLYVEQFIQRHWPNVISKVENEPAFYQEHGSQWYQLRHAITLDVLLTVKYCVAGNDLRCFTTAYRLAPKLADPQSTLLEGWSSDRVTDRM